MKKLTLLAVLTGSVLTSISQNIGIGITNPTRAKLEVNGAAGNSSTVAIFGGEATGISLQRNWPSIGFNQYYNEGSKYIGNGFAAVQYLDPYNGGIYTDLFSNGTTNAACSPPRRVMSILQSGAIALNGTTHNTVFNSGASEDTYICAGKDGGKVIINDIPNGITRLSGRVEVFGGSLQVSGSFTIRNTWDHWTMYVADNSGDLELLTDYGNIGTFNYSNGNYSTPSDIRLKKNISTLAPVLNKVMLLQPVEYDMITDKIGDSRSIGFIAQDVRKLFPELVEIISGKRGAIQISDLNTLNYSGFGVIAIKAIQEQQIIIQTLLSRIEKLEAKQNATVSR